MKQMYCIVRVSYLKIDGSEILNTRNKAGIFIKTTIDY